VEEMCIKSIDYNNENISINVLEILLSVFKNFTISDELREKILPKIKYQIPHMTIK
jgi:hypothetical protein